MASSFKIKTDPSQAMKQTCVLNFRRPFLQVSNVQLTIKHVVKSFRQFLVFVFDPIPKNENAESAESLKKFSLLFQWYLLTKYRCFGTYNQCYYTVESLFHIFPPLTFAVLILKWRIGVVASFLKIKIDLNQAMKQACVLTQL